MSLRRAIVAEFIGTALLLATVVGSGIMAARLKLMSHPERLLMLCRMDESETSVTELVELTQ